MSVQLIYMHVHVPARPQTHTQQATHYICISIYLTVRNSTNLLPVDMDGSELCSVLVLHFLKVVLLLNPPGATGLPGWAVDWMGRRPSWPGPWAGPVRWGGAGSGWPCAESRWRWAGAGWGPWKNAATMMGADSERYLQENTNLLLLIWGSGVTHSSAINGLIRILGHKCNL